jgi:hypothetical protein
MKNAEKFIKFRKLKKNAEKFRIECFFDFIASLFYPAKSHKKFRKNPGKFKNSEKC